MLLPNPRWWWSGWKFRRGVGPTAVHGKFCPIGDDFIPDAYHDPGVPLLVALFIGLQPINPLQPLSDSSGTACGSAIKIRGDVIEGAPCEKTLATKKVIKISMLRRLVRPRAFPRCHAGELGF